jgi:hypothetical protein
MQAVAISIETITSEDHVRNDAVTKWTGNTTKTQLRTEENQGI